MEDDLSRSDLSRYCGVRKTPEQLVSERDDRIATLEHQVGVLLKVVQSQEERWACLMSDLERAEPGYYGDEMFSSIGRFASSVLVDLKPICEKVPDLSSLVGEANEDS